jgi:hypothetical protein
LVVDDSVASEGLMSSSGLQELCGGSFGSRLLHAADSLAV